MLLPYVDSWEYTNGGIYAATDYVYVANGLWDPYHPLGGHQPRGYDEIMRLYNRYCVNKCTAELEFTLMNNVTDVSDVVFAYFSLDETPFIPVDVSSAMEMSMACGGQARHIGKSGTVPSSAKMYLSCDIGKLLSARKDREARSSGDSANPDSKVYLHVGVKNNNSTGISHKVFLTVKLLYDASFYEPKDPLAS